PGYSPHYRQQLEHGIKRGPQNDSNMDSDGYRRPIRSSYEDERSSYANEPAPRRPVSQASTGHYPQQQQQQSRSIGNTDRPGYYQVDIPSAPRMFNVRRTVFMRIPYKAASVSGSIRSKLSKFGEIADMLELPNKSVCYVMFYDSRDAANAINVLKNDFYIGDAHINIVESRHRPTAFTRSPQQTDYQASVLVSLVGAKRGFEDSDRVHFERYGEICAFYPYYGSDTEWVIEYYDCRAARDAALNCHGQAACKGTMYTTFLWDDSVPRPESSSEPSLKKFRMSNTVSDTTMSGASAVSALNQLVSRAPRHDSQSTMVADISPLIPSKDLARTLGGLLDYPPSAVALTESANAAASAVRTAPRYDAAAPRDTSVTSAQFSGFDTASSSATAVSAMVPSVSKHGYPTQQQLYQGQEHMKSMSLDNDNEGVNSLLGILAQVRKSVGASNDLKKR
ncbi:hypothetical protein H4S07_004912, partial [Coemansia furcata]